MQRPLLPAPPAASSARTVEGEVLRVTYENEQSAFRVLRVEVEGRTSPVTVVGVAPPVAPGARIRATGRHVRDPSHGEQFKADSILVVDPCTTTGLERFLASRRMRGIGPALARKIVETFGDETLSVLDRAPERLREVPGIGVKRAADVARAWADERERSGALVFLQGHGVSTALAARIVRRFGKSAIDVVARSPYRLALDVWGIGFHTADRIARSVGISPEAPERARAGVLHVLHEHAERGHVLAARGGLLPVAARLLDVDEAAVERALDELGAEGRVILERGPDGVAVYLPELCAAERRLAARLARLGAEPAPLRGVAEVIRAHERATGMELDPAQRAAVELSARHRAVIVTGGPGVGKTTILRVVLLLLERAGLRVCLAAPTGRAAKRMSEATERVAATIHRLLKYDPKQRRFGRHADHPLAADAVVIDEASMLDLPLADALVDALPRGARLVLVGDVDQLPSVGPGAVLRDALVSGCVPAARLTRIFRQARGSLISENAHRIQRGDLPEGTSGPDGEFFVIERRGAEEAAQAVLDLVTTRIPRKFGLDPVRDVQVLSPMHRGAAGTAALNEALQAALNPRGPSVLRGSRVFRVGDKVMQLRNDYEREVWNGDVGHVVRVLPEERRILVDFDDREVACEEGQIDELSLAYATTIHKSQGSEYPAVVIPLVTQHFVMLSRNLLYTAVTRGKSLVVLVADPRAVSLALNETRREERETRLALRIRAHAARR